MQESGYQLFTDSVANEPGLSKSRKDRPSDEKVDAILQSLSLTALRDRHPTSLSGGEKQRAAIGTAMAHDAEVLIFHGAAQRAVLWQYAPCVGRAETPSRLTAAWIKLCWIRSCA
jgi:ABC-type molybdenum transport system ATPase subunit/photorepair protein PhrA